MLPLSDSMEWLIRQVLAVRPASLQDDYEPVYFPGDDLLAALRPHGLPIGNLTSQWWANCYLNPFDQFVKRELRYERLHLADAELVKVRLYLRLCERWQWINPGQYHHASVIAMSSWPPREIDRDGQIVQSPAAWA